MFECEYHNLKIESNSNQALVNLSKVEVRPFHEDDIVKIATMHREIFPEYFLSHLGVSFLSLFYREFLHSNQNCGYVAEYNDKLIGLVAGTKQSVQFFQQFYGRNFARVAFLILKGLLTDKVVRRSIRKRTTHFRYAWQSFWRPKITSISSGKINSCQPFSILSLGVKQEYRGLGVAEKLLIEYCAQLYIQEVQKVSLTVLPHNSRAIAFYNKCGWYEESHSTTSIRFSYSFTQINTFDKTNMR
ncbi:acetyltransferase [Desulfosporosinus acidiphilus SJ4]|uniref:N-alpha-acetyltransferase 60 n=1 Tax=Desulfosporosinus acidiphilus (strain DSM 22704 / JCM 16185 / SJ4) TaxID=646529 RepID=I4D2B8_DESAJ|nr:GNAT family N-acetyltransferase [Desulfosporosinus acidiphilus]AFM39942.1 acetyltransferase [Desulfosporosinus acidiphilus SJ4]